LKEINNGKISEITFHNEKNLLIISPNFLAFVYDQVKELAPNFNKVYVIVVHPKKRNKKKNKKLSDMNRIDRKGIPPNVHIFEGTYFALPGELFLPLRGILSYYTVKKIIVKNNIKYDIIHAHFLWPLGYVGTILKNQTKTPLIVTGHGYDVYGLPFISNRWRIRMSRLLDQVDGIITVSESNKSCLSKLTKNPINVISNGYDSSKFKPMNINTVRKTLSLPTDKKIILSIGNLERVKGHIYLIEAANEILKDRTDVLFIIVGGGNEKIKLEKLIAKYHIERNVKLIGPKPHEEIPAWMNACDIYVQPSLSEGVPTVLFEAMACGKPYVGTNVGGIPEIIMNEKLGFMVPPKNHDALAAAINKALTMNWDEKYIYNHAEQFTWDKISSKILEIYKEMLKPEKAIE
jgi:glycosyltransferase involved in cell wall biosynthesis